jgi:hypothetical protein
MDNYKFSIQTMQTMVGGSLKSTKPDADGVYRGIPIAVLGKPSRNNALYEPNSVINSMVNPESLFYKSLAEGHLEGEWGHPAPVGDVKTMINRTMRIDRENVSHYFTKIWSEPTRDGKLIIIYADIVPFGPRGDYLRESFESANRNTAFSLRSLTANPVKLASGVLSKKVLAMVTYDAVGCPGFEEASERFQVGNESFALEEVEFGAITSNDIIEFPSYKKVVGFEAIEHSELSDIFAADKVIIGNVTSQGRIDDFGSFVSNEGIKSSVFHLARK